MIKLTTAYHGTTKENYDIIQQDGFKVGSYFAWNLADSLEFGGPWVFQVAFEEERFNNMDDPNSNWQFHTREIIPSDRIVAGFLLAKRPLYNNKLLKDTVFWSSLSPEHREQNERVGITFDPFKGILGDTSYDSVG